MNEDGDETIVYIYFKFKEVKDALYNYYMDVDDARLSWGSQHLLERKKMFNGNDNIADKFNTEKFNEGKSEIPTFDYRYGKQLTSLKASIGQGETACVPVYSWADYGFSEAKNTPILLEKNRVKIGSIVHKEKDGIKIMNLDYYPGDAPIEKVKGAGDHIVIEVGKEAKPGDHFIIIDYPIIMNNVKYYKNLMFYIKVEERAEGYKQEGAITIDGSTGEIKSSEEISADVETEIEEAEEELDSLITISNGTNGDLIEYNEDLNTLITSINDGDFEIDAELGENSTNLIETALSYITFFGIVIGMIGLAILGFRYIMGSAANKSEYKETLVTFSIGAAILICGTQIVKFILGIALNW